jgi:RimJ/RimL family protein N-acetyltransferase
MRRTTGREIDTPNHQSNVQLEPWDAGDLPLLEQVMGDPAMTEHLGGPESREKLAERQARYERAGSGMFKIVEEATGEAVGSVGYWERTWRGEQVYEVGWSVIPAFQGRGIAGAATAQAIGMARAARKHRFLHAFPSVDNAPSNAICRKLGFTLVEESEFEYPPGNFMRCNDWRLDLFAEDESGAELGAIADLATPMAVRVAATMRIADHIVHGLQTASELADAVNADADALDRVLRHLAVEGVLSRDASGRYGLTPRGEALRDDHPRGMRTMLDIESAIGRADLSFVQLLHSVRTGKPGFPVQFGRPFWDDLAADALRTASYDAQMGVDVAADVVAIVSAFDWGSLGHVVDVGGGNGTLLIAILRAHPALRGTVFDQPNTAEAARRALVAAGLANRSHVVAGSFFDPLPPGAGGYLLSAIIHDWDDDAARAILRRCAEAAGKDGAVFIIEKIGADGETLRTGMDLRMLVYFGGKERGVAELTDLAADSGLRVAAVHPAGALSIVELTAS